MFLKKSLFIGLVFPLLFISCSKEKIFSETINLAVSSLNAYYPHAVDETTVLDSMVCHMDTKDVTINISYNYPDSLRELAVEDINDIDAPLASRLFVAEFREDETLRKFLDMMAGNDYKLKLSYYANNTHIRTIEITKEIYANDESVDQVIEKDFEWMRQDIADLKGKLPYEIDDITVLTDVRVDESSHTLSYIYEVDATQDDFDEDGIESVYENNFESIQENLFVYKRNHFNFDYIYLSKEADTLFAFYFTPEDYE